MDLSQKRGFQIRIFLPDGTPDGLRLVEKSNWTGRGLVCPRSLYVAKKQRSEFHKTGIYLLYGPSEESDLLNLYIGEGDPVKQRLDSHFAKKEFWTYAIVFGSKDENLNKAHVQYLEARLVNLATSAKRSILENANVPERPSLSEADTADMEQYLEEMLLIFPLLGLTVFQKPPESKADSRALLSATTKGVTAKGYESPQGFVVLKGSEVCKDEAPSIHKYISELRKSLCDRGVIDIKARENCWLLTQDYTFNSPSTAAGVIFGRSTNGREVWRNKDGVTLKELQEKSVCDVIKVED